MPGCAKLDGLNVFLLQKFKPSSVLTYANPGIYSLFKAKEKVIALSFSDKSHFLKNDGCRTETMLAFL